MRADIQGLLDDCGKPGWDGYSAAPIAQTTAGHAEHFCILLAMAGFELPPAIPEPSGAIGFEWKDDHANWFIASIEPNGTVSVVTPTSEGSPLLPMLEAVQQVLHALKGS